MPTPLKVLFLTACSGRGGAGHSLYFLVKYLDRDRIEPLVVMASEGVIGKKLRALGVKTIVAPRLRERFHEIRYARKNLVTTFLSYVRNVWDGLLFLPQLVRIVRREDVDLIYCNHLMVKIMGVLVGRLSGRPVVLHTRTIYSRVERFVYGLFAASRHVKAIVAVSQAAAANYPRLAGKVHVVPNGVDLEDHRPGHHAGGFRRQRHLSERTLIVGYLGRLVRWKGIDVFLEAAEELAAARPSLVFAVIGDRPVGTGGNELEGYRTRFKNRGLEGRIVFTGFQPDIRPYLADLDVLVVPSISPDPCPRTVIEAMAFGIPVIGSAIGGIPELIEHEGTGLLVEAGNVVDLAASVLRVVDDPALRGRLGARAQQAVFERFNAEVVAQTVQRIILDVAGGRGPRARERPVTVRRPVEAATTAAGELES